MKCLHCGASTPQLLCEKVLAGAYSGLGGMFIEADEIPSGQPSGGGPVYAREYNVPLV